MIQNFENYVTRLENVEHQAQQNDDHSTAETPFACSVQPFTNVCFVYPNEESGQYQVPFALLTDIQPDNSFDQYHSTPEIAPHDEVTQPRVPVIPFPNPPAIPISTAPATSIPEVSFTPTSSKASV